MSIKQLLKGLEFLDKQQRTTEELRECSMLIQNHIQECYELDLLTKKNIFELFQEAFDKNFELDLEKPNKLYFEYFVLEYCNIKTNSI